MRAVITDNTAGVYACTPTEAASEDPVDEGVGFRIKFRILNLWSGAYPEPLRPPNRRAQNRSFLPDMKGSNFLRNHENAA